MANRKIRILICNRYVLFRAGIKALLRKQPPFEIVGEAGTVRGAVKQVQRLKPDIVLMGEAEADWSISEVTRCIKVINPDVKVLIVNLSDDQRLFSGCLDAGASGYMRKDDDASRLRSAIGAAVGKNGHGHLKTFVA